MKIEFTAEAMKKPEYLSAKAALAWDYFEFGRTWLAAEAANGEIIVTDESADLNDAFVFPDEDNFLCWLEAGTDEKLADDPKEYLIACGAVNRALASDAVIASIVAELQCAPEPPDGSVAPSPVIARQSADCRGNPSPLSPSAPANEKTDAPAPGEYAGGSARGGVDWSYYDADRFMIINTKYLPAYGEGDTMASQIVTAVNKLVYKWYNDGDVYDNTHGMDGWCNDLSSYANWLCQYVPKTRDILDRIEDCYTHNAYERILKDLADYCLNEKRLAEYATQEKTGTIYKCDGPFAFRDYDEEED